MRIRRVVRPTVGACSDTTGRNPVDIRLGELMKERRKHLGLTKTGLAARLALTKDDIRRYERGEVPFGADMLAVLPIALKVRTPFFTDAISHLVRRTGVTSHAQK